MEDVKDKNKMSPQTFLKRAKNPEAAGVSSRAVADLVEDFKASGLDIHSLMILRRGEVAYESFAAPYSPETPHTMYSVSKSFTSTAIGFAIEEGLLTLDTPILEIFPEHRPSAPDEYLETMTIRHLLNMTAGKSVSFLVDRTGDTWVQDFFQAKWKSSPGEVFNYVNENIYMLCAVLHRVTGMTVSEYLTPRLYEPLGYGRVPYWETDPGGIESGGWGLFATTEELAKMALCYHQGGKFEGKQVVPENWVREATKKQAETAAIRETLDGEAGYGYCFWRNHIENSFRLDGMFSQFGIVLEDYDAVIVTTGGEILSQKTRDCIWRHFPAGFTDEVESDIPESLPSLRAFTELPALPRSPYEKIITGRVMDTQRKRLLEIMNMPLSMLPAAILYMSADKAGGVDQFSFSFEEDECFITWSEGDETNTVACGMDGIPRKTPIRLAGIDWTASCTAAWTEEKTLSFWLRPLEAACQRRVDFVFDGFDAEVYFTTSPPNRKVLHAIAENVDELIVNPAASKAAKGVIENAYRLIEPTLKGRLQRREE